MISLWFDLVLLHLCLIVSPPPRVYILHFLVSFVSASCNSACSLLLSLGNPCSSVFLVFLPSLQFSRSPCDSWGKLPGDSGNSPFVYSLNWISLPALFVLPGVINWDCSRLSLSTCPLKWSSLIEELRVNTDSENGLMFLPAKINISIYIKTLSKWILIWSLNLVQNPDRNALVKNLF